MEKKRVVIFLLMFLLVFSSSVSAATTLPQPERTNETKTSTIKSISKAEVEEQYKDSDIVRVIVELESEPVIDYAQKQKKRYKELPEATKKKLKDEKLAEQKKVKDKVKKKNVKFQEKESFTTVVNGFSAEVKYGDIKQIEALPEVSNVQVTLEYERPEETPDMIYSKEMVQAQEAWRDYGFKGEGLIVGVIDTGIDPTHRDMVVSSKKDIALTKSSVNKYVKENELKGKYYSDKVPYGYNYMDENNVIRDIAPGASMHGMHVAGTVGANGDEENGGIKGIAPEAQLLALKVFGNDPEVAVTYSDIYVKAIDDAIILGADVLNMSLGSTSGFVNAETQEQKAIERAVDNGILMSISAGNSAHFGNGWANPWATNPDIGVSGSPGISYDSLQVASVENTFMDLDAVNYTIDGVAEKAPFLSASSVHPNDVATKSFEIAYGGLGYPEELSNVAGKYALIKRGELAFVDKALNAQNAGALGVIIYNNADGYVNMQSDAAITIPQLFMLKNDGDKLAAALTAGKPVTISFNGEKTTAPNPEGGKMSGFSSWGLTPNLDFKPEITAPGGQIYSTLENNQYGMMSGTSMAAPHVSGGAALVLERVDNEFGVTGFDRVNIAKNILMNTSSPIKDQGFVNGVFGWDNPYSPRKQGAGIMQLHSALKTPVIVTEKNTNEAKVPLKEVGDEFEFTLTAKNYSNEAVSYDVSANLQTDFAGWGELGYDLDVLEAAPIYDATILVDGQASTTVTVPANGSVSFKVEADLSTAKVVEPSTGELVDASSVFPNGYFVEGFVTLKDIDDVNPTLTVPYVGFKGEWDKAPIIDGMAYDEESFYGMGGAVYDGGSTYNYLGYDPLSDTIVKDNIAISPNGDNIQDEIIPILSFLRNAKQVEFAVLDEDGKEVRKVRTENEIVKNYYDGGLAPNYTLDSLWEWDGKINNAQAADGQYYYEIRAVIDYPNAKWQSVSIPVKVDTVKPNIEAEREDGNLVLDVEDNENGSGVSYIDILVEGNSILTAPLAGDANEFALPEEVQNSVITVVAYDNAGNTTELEVEPAEEDVETTPPFVYLLNPEALESYNSNVLRVNGYIIEEGSGLKEFTIAGQEIPVQYNASTKRYEFDSTIKVEDNFHRLTVKAIDNAGNEFSIKRDIIVDATGPVIEVKGVPKDQYIKFNGKNPVVDVKVTDNFDEIRFYLNGNEEFYQQFQEPFAMRSFSKTFEDYVLELEDGWNTFTFEAVDIAGNKTTETIELYKLKKGEKEPKGKGKK
ncbi:S8 family serine peptidase [Robertmurraya kyonggiensis]|uniref:Lactocepin n=1 Tax=Robertmurraya kyonggiensis TaxID=1037680 RepID=A0A4U1DA99_9BACI|nr:S8 family serine peptidase [Robertmurraya kyonggiensis]TKC19499.1 lactocepin [Robertmurraya kyonggiensis]